MVKENVIEEKIVNKIKKLMSITEESNATQAEVEQAALLAQKLLSKYNIDYDIINIDKEIEIVNNEISYKDYKGYQWARQLSVVIAKNYCCKVYLSDKSIVFYGYSQNTDVAKEIFKSMFKFGNENALAYCRNYAKAHGHSRGVYNSFCLGFVAGIKSVLDEQCKALQIVVPEKVEIAYNNLGLMRGSRAHLNTNSDKDGSIYNSGFCSGRDAISQKRVTDGNK